MSQPTAEHLVIAARHAAKNAYAPYSNFKVGAAAVFDDSIDIYTGCNVENQSYGLTICAERAAIFSAIAAGQRKLLTLAIVALNADGADIASLTPCGACLQCIAEFGCATTGILLPTVGLRLLGELLPVPFNTTENLGSRR
ncbi:cytidine deaminase [Sphingorhabdus sp.]|uniref:cytidine deaminase n=1 Tax=Sphingorhabdus sp. TaxID=1902408 RepID=UPI0033411462